MRTVLIPHSRRPTVQRTVASLLDTGLIDQIIICDCCSENTLASFESHAAVSIINISLAQFCKASLLNVGIARVVSGHILISDADILWERKGLSALLSSVDEKRSDFCWLRSVSESEDTKSSLDQQSRQGRLGFRVESRHDCAEVVIFNDNETAATRPGYGLIYAHVECFLQVGGYKDHWGGLWGWEDVDLIIRAQLLGLTVSNGGWASHLSHSDNLRSLYGKQKARTRDENLEKSREHIEAGLLYGPLRVLGDACLRRVTWKDERRLPPRQSPTKESDISGR